MRGAGGLLAGVTASVRGTTRLVVVCLQEYAASFVRGMNV